MPTAIEHKGPAEGHTDEQKAKIKERAKRARQWREEFCQKAQLSVLFKVGESIADCIDAPQTAQVCSLISAFTGALAAVSGAMWWKLSDDDSLVDGSVSCVQTTSSQSDQSQADVQTTGPMTMEGPLSLNDDVHLMRQLLFSEKEVMNRPQLEIA